MCVLHFSSQHSATALPHGLRYTAPSLKLCMLGVQRMLLAFLLNKVFGILIIAAVTLCC